MRNRSMSRSDETTLLIYTFIRNFCDEYGLPPSQREIAEGCHLVRSGVIRHLDRLESWGCIIRKLGRARGITLTGKRPPFPTSGKK